MPGNCCGKAEEKKVDDVGFINALIEELEANYAIDPRRIYVTGMSNGAMMSYRLACELGDPHCGHSSSCWRDGPLIVFLPNP